MNNLGLTISFQFHHTQMYGAHAGNFLEALQDSIGNIGRYVDSAQYGTQSRRFLNKNVYNFYNPTSKEDFQLRKEQLLSGQDILNNSAQLDSLLILSNSTWKKLSDSIDNSFKWDYYLFNGEGLENSSPFQNDLLNEIIVLSHGKMLMNPEQQAIKNKIPDYQDEILNYEGNELEAARSWHVECLVLMSKIEK